MSPPRRSSHPGTGAVSDPTSPQGRSTQQGMPGTQTAAQHPKTSQHRTAQARQTPQGRKSQHRMAPRCLKPPQAQPRSTRPGSSGPRCTDPLAPQAPRCCSTPAQGMYCIRSRSQAGQTPQTSPPGTALAHQSPPRSTTPADTPRRSRCARPSHPACACPPQTRRSAPQHTAARWPSSQPSRRPVQLRMPCTVSYCSAPQPHQTSRRGTG